MISWSYVGVAPSAVPLVGYAVIERDKVTGDVKLPVRIIRGPDAIVQRIKQKFGFFLGEWFLDQRLGLPYFEDILVKNPDIGQVTSIFRSTLVGTPGLGQVLSINVEVDKRTRTGSVNFEALLEDPSVIVRAVDAPFKLR
jgi:hypothetical protein